MLLGLLQLLELLVLGCGCPGDGAVDERDWGEVSDGGQGDAGTGCCAGSCSSSSCPRGSCLLVVRRRAGVFADAFGFAGCRFGCGGLVGVLRGRGAAGFVCFAVGVAAGFLARGLLDAVGFGVFCCCFLCELLLLLVLALFAVCLALGVAGVRLAPRA